MREKNKRLYVGNIFLVHRIMAVGVIMMWLLHQKQFVGSNLVDGFCMKSNPQRWMNVPLPVPLYFLYKEMGDANTSLVASSCEASTTTGVSWYFPQSLDHGGQVQVSERKSKIQLPASSVDLSLVPSTQWQFQVWPQLLQTLMALSSLEESIQVKVSEWKLKSPAMESCGILLGGPWLPMAAAVVCHHPAAIPSIAAGCKYHVGVSGTLIPDDEVNLKWASKRMSKWRLNTC